MCVCLCVCGHGKFWHTQGGSFWLKLRTFTMLVEIEHRYTCMAGREVINRRNKNSHPNRDSANCTLSVASQFSLVPAIWHMRGPSHMMCGPSHMMCGPSHMMCGPSHMMRDPSHMMRDPSHMMRGPSHIIFPSFVSNSAVGECHMACT